VNTYLIRLYSPSYREDKTIQAAYWDIDVHYLVRFYDEKDTATQRVVFAAKMQDICSIELKGEARCPFSASNPTP